MDNNCSTTPKPNSAKELLKSWHFWKPFLGVTLGALGGFMYYYFVGCQSGSCAITSNPVSSVIAGGILGFFVSNSPCLKCS